MRWIVFITSGSRTTWGRRLLRAVGAALVLAQCPCGRVAIAKPAVSVSGTTKDALERPVVGADVRLETADGRVVAATVTDEAGRFAFTDVAPGTYAIVAARSGFETATDIATVEDAAAVSVTLTMASTHALDVDVRAKRLPETRTAIPPTVGTSTYEITNGAIDDQPGGEHRPLTQILLQAPGITQDSSNLGGIHVRHQMENVQYRINGVPLPEGAIVFGQSGGLSPRLASSVVLLTGALPAEYGLRTSGIVDIRTRSGAFEHGGHVSLYGGSHGWIEPSVEDAGSTGRFNHFVTGDYLENDLGISPATPHGAIHDHTRQGHAFGYFEYLPDSSSKVSAVLGTFVGHFEIPDRPNATPSFVVNGVSSFDSTKVDETQLEQNHFAVVSYERSDGPLSSRLSALARYGEFTFHPDPLADLVFNGIAQRVRRSSIAGGIDADASWVATPAHTLRAGVVVTIERTTVQTSSSVLPAIGGTPTSDVPFTIFESRGKTGATSGVFVEDAWRVVPSVTINGGVRFDDLEAFTSERQVSPRLNAVWTPTTSTTVHAGYARYFTPPRQESVSTASIARFANTTAEPAVTKNAPVRAERADYVDAGVVQRIVPDLTIGLDAYYKRSDYHLDEGQFGAPVFLTPFNYRRAENFGIELTASYAIDGFSAYGNLAAARQIARGIASAQALFDPDELAWINRHWIVTDHSQLITASAGLAYRWRDTRASVDLISGSGLRRTVRHPNDATNPPYEQLNVGVSQRFTLPALGPLEARFDVINVLDQNYVLRDGTGIGVFARQFGPPRGFFAGLKKGF